MTAHTPVMDGHMLSLGKNPQPHIVQHIQALTDTHRHRSAPYILESIYLKKKSLPSSVSRERYKAICPVIH